MKQQKMLHPFISFISLKYIPSACTVKGMKWMELLGHLNSSEKEGALLSTNPTLHETTLHSSHNGTVMRPRLTVSESILMILNATTGTYSNVAPKDFYLIILAPI